MLEPDYRDMDLAAFRKFCKDHAAELFVRDQKTPVGLIETVQFNELPEAQQDYWIDIWAKKRGINA